MSNELKQTLSLQDAISIVAGSMIGCGIFIVSADIARQVESAWKLHAYNERPTVVTAQDDNQHNDRKAEPNDG